MTKTLTKDQIKAGQRIFQVAHPEYGDWTIVEHYSGGMWNVRGRSGMICTCEGELTKFWAIAK
ncbi:MAG TPA: hypothetical protein DCG72_11230 [Gammaproteobacteria bacterium]|nr:hypothetical protein [Gammaproteobacteria bacterium]